MWSQREVVDYSLQRLASLERHRKRGLDTLSSNTCDADPLLLRTAHHHGVRAPGPCPVCASTSLVLLHYTYGHQLGQYSGRVKAPRELEEMARNFGEFTVYVVEVCPQCRWNHLVQRFVLGDGVARKPPRRQPTAEDIYG